MSGYLPPVHVGPVSIRRAGCPFTRAALEWIVNTTWDVIGHAPIVPVKVRFDRAGTYYHAVQGGFRKGRRAFNDEKNWPLVWNAFSGIEGVTWGPGEDPRADGGVRIDILVLPPEDTPEARERKARQYVRVLAHELTHASDLRLLFTPDDAAATSLPHLSAPAGFSVYGGKVEEYAYAVAEEVVRLFFREWAVKLCRRSPREKSRQLDARLRRLADLDGLSGTDLPASFPYCRICHRTGPEDDFLRDENGEVLFCKSCAGKEGQRWNDSPARWLMREIEWRKKGIVRPDGKPFLKEDFLQLLAAQNETCPVCREPLPLGTKRGLVLDHEHVSGDGGPARGLLHPWCNLSVVGSNTISSLPNLTHYLTDPPAQRALLRGKERLEPEHLLPTRCYRRAKA